MTFSPSSRGPLIAGDDGAGELAPMLGGKRIDRQNGLQADKRAELLRGTGQELPVLLHHRPRVLEVPEDRTGIDRLHGMSLEQKAGDDPEIPTTAAQAPEQIGVLRLAGSHDLAAGEHDIGLDEVIDGEAMLARQVTHAATQRQAGDTCGGDNAEGDREPIGMGGVVDIARRATSLDADGLAPGSTRMPFMADRSITSPSSTLPRPGPLCPPPRTATRRPCLRPKLTAATTSLTSTHRAIISGRLSIMPLKSLRASS